MCDLPKITQHQGNRARALYMAVYVPERPPRLPPTSPQWEQDPHHYPQGLCCLSLGPYTTVLYQGPSLAPMEILCLGPQSRSGQGLLHSV